MTTAWKYITIFFWLGVGIVTDFIGGFDGTVKALLIISVADYVIGTVAALKKGTFNSNIGFDGIAKRVVMLALIGIPHAVDVYLLHDGQMRTAYIWLCISNQGLSLFENAGKLGLPMPKQLKQMFQQLHLPINDDGKAEN